MALDNRSGLGHHLAMWNAFACFDFGNAFGGFTNILFDEINAELEYVVEQVLRRAARFFGETGQAAHMGWAKRNFHHHDARLLACFLEQGKSMRHLSLPALRPQPE